VLSYLACATETIRFATNVFVLPLRHPLITARSVVTLDRLSGGRVTLGIGVGWLEPEFRWVDVPFEARGRITDETIDVLRRLWSEEVVDHRGEHFEFGPLKFAPKPIQQPIPIEVGGTSPAALRRAGRLGSGWIEHGTTTFDELSERISRIQAERVAADRSSEPFEITVSGALASNLDDMRRARDLGATRILLSPFVQGRPSIQDIEDWGARFIDEIMTAIDD
jgi:probable F420-dependent oxidoreductase